MRDKQEKTPTRTEAFQKRLEIELENSRERVQRLRNELPTDDGPDDSAEEATRNAHRDLTLGNLERGVRTILEIETALKRIGAGTYGTCLVCEGKISDARLRALPWTRTCIQCAGGRPPTADSEIDIGGQHSQSAD